MLAIHLKCGRADGVSLNNLSYDKSNRSFRSGQWDISIDDARSLVGGWVYLHSAKSARSEFGGLVVGFEPVVDHSLAHENRIILVIEKRMEGTEQRWRGKSHTMAHEGGTIDAQLPHELGET